MQERIDDVDLSAEEYVDLLVERFEHAGSAPQQTAVLLYVINNELRGVTLEFLSRVEGALKARYPGVSLYGLTAKEQSDAIDSRM